MRFLNDKQNSRVAAIAIVLFVVFDFAALALNYWLSAHIEQQAIYINLADRQRMLSQRMVKVLLQLEKAHQNAKDTSALRKELQLTFELFDHTLQGFDRGHTTKGGRAENLFIPAIGFKEARDSIDAAVELWQPYRVQILHVLNAGPTLTDDILQPAIRIAEDSNLQLLDQMNRLTTMLELRTQEEAREIRIYQTSAFGLALANFFWAFVVYRRRIHDFSRNHNLLDDIINKISASVLVLDQHGMVIKSNHEASIMFGYDINGLPGLPFGHLLKENSTDGLLGQRQDGTTFMAQVERNAAIFEQQEIDIVTVLDITQQRMTEDHLSSLAYHDILTHLPNRLLFDERLQLEISHAQRKEQMLAVLYLDLDKFKPVNDTYGHEIGDLLLKDVAIRLRSCLRESDTVSRRGGDEFTIITPNIDTRESCEKVAMAILEQVERPFHIQGLELNIGCSIGISIFPADGNNAHLLVGRADVAMYQAKQIGRGTYHFYRHVIETQGESS